MKSSPCNKRSVARSAGASSEKTIGLSLHKETCQLAHENALVAMEELAIKNMNRSNKGTVDNPGKNVPQKAGLNWVLYGTPTADHVRN